MLHSSQVCSEVDSTYRGPSQNKPGCNQINTPGEFSSQKRRKKMFFKNRSYFTCTECNTFRIVLRKCRCRLRLVIYSLRSNLMCCRTIPSPNLSVGKLFFSLKKPGGLCGFEPGLKPDRIKTGLDAIEPGFFCSLM